MIEVPCRGCANRFLGCHDKCNAYCTYKKNKDKIKQKIREDKWLNSLAYFRSGIQRVKI